MKQIKNDTLDRIKGGTTTITGTILNAIVDILKLIKDAGYSVGSGIRRISENELCPLK